MAMVNPDTQIRLPNGQYIAAALAGPVVGGKVSVHDDTIIRLPGGGTMAAGAIRSSTSDPGYDTWFNDPTVGHPTAAPKPAAPKPAASAEPTAAPRDFAGEAGLLFPWIPAPLRQVFVDAWTRYGDVNLAMAALRRDPSYDQFFAGNRNADGTTILPEAEYLSTMEGYDRQLTSFGLDPANYMQKKIQALQGGNSPLELGAKIGKMFVGIVTKADQYRAYYAQKYGDGNLSNTALFDAALDGTISPYEAERRIGAAQVGGAAALNGFDLARQEADRLQSFGLDDAGARSLFAKAKGELPTLNTLQQRFADPGDPLTAEHYADALVLNDPSQLETIGRLYARDHAQYTGGGLFTATDRSGAQGGLLSR